MLGGLDYHSLYAAVKRAIGSLGGGLLGRTITGTANEVSVTNGDGVGGDPTISLPNALTFTGKTVTGGTFSGITLSGSCPGGGATVSGNITFSGVPILSGGGITFPAAQVASAGANTLDDYEEGTFTVSDSSGAGLTLGSTTAYYVKVGQVCLVQIGPSYPATANGAQVTMGTLPFTNTSNEGALAIGFCSSATADVMAYIPTGGTTIRLYTTAGAALANSAMSSKSIVIGGTYRTSA